MTDRDPQRPSGGSEGAQSASDALRDLLETHRSDLRCVELCPICRAADILRATAPDDLRDQWHVVQREALLTMKELVDRAVDRLEEQERERPTKVEDIPIS